MKRLVNDLWDETRGAFDRLPVWLPGTRMDLGDVGVFGDTGWVKQTTLAALGITQTTEPAGAPTDYTYVSSDGAEVSGGVNASVDPAFTGIPVGNAGLRVRFSRAGAFVLHADRVAVRRIGNLQEVDERILAAYQGGAWKRQWVLVSEVARAAAVLVIVSAGREGEAVVDLGVNLDGLGQPLASAGTALRIATRKGIAASFASSTGAAVLWQGRQVRDRWWRSAPEVRGTEPQRGTTAVPGPASGGQDRVGAEVVEIEHLADLDADQPAGGPDPTTS